MKRPSLAEIEAAARAYRSAASGGAPPGEFMRQWERLRCLVCCMLYARPKCVRHECACE